MDKDIAMKRGCFEGEAKEDCFRPVSFQRASVFVLIFLSLFLVSCAGGVGESKNAGNDNDTSEKKTEIAETISVSRAKLDSKIESKENFLVYIGRPSCPDCVEFEPKLEKILEGGTNQNLYYFNSDVEKVSERKEMKKYVLSFGIEEIPAVLNINDGEVVRIYDCQKDSDILEVEKILKKGV